MDYVKPLTKPLATMLLLAWITPSFAGGREIECGSSSGRHNYCSTGRHGDIRLLNQTSFSKCEEGRSWGTESEGIWVDNGCRAKFWVDDEGHGKHGKNNAAIIAGVAGLAVLGAMLLSNSKHDGDASAASASSEPIKGEIPTWAVGNYHGYNPLKRAEVTMQVGSGGRVNARMKGKSLYGVLENGRVSMDGGQRFRMEQTDHGLRLSDLDDRDNIIDLYRDR